MQIPSAISSQTLRFNFTSESQRQNLLGRLAQGQVLEARVLDRLSEGRFAVRFMGHTLVAESRLSLVPGQLVEARVQDLGPPLVLSLSGGARSEGAALGQALRNLGLVDDRVNRAAVKALIARGLPVDPQEVQVLRNLLGRLGGAIDLENADLLEETLSRALFLRGQGLPVTPDTLAAYLSHLPPGALGGLLEGLTGLLRSLRLPRRPGADLSALAARILAALPEAGTLTGDSLERLLDGLGLDLEGKLATWIASGGNGLPQGVEDSLKLALLRLQAHLQALPPDALDSATDKSFDLLRERTREALQLLDTLQASDLPTPDREAIYLQIPLLFNGQPTTADLTLTCREKGGRRIDPDNLHLTLALDLSALDPLRIDLSVLQKQASCCIYADANEKAAFLQTASDELKAALEACGYTVSDIASRVAKPVQTDPPADSPPTVGVDFRV